MGDRSDHRTERFGGNGRSGREDLENEPDRAGSDQVDAPGAQYTEPPADVAGRAFVSDAGNSLYRALAADRPGEAVT